MDSSRKVITADDKSALIQVLALFFLTVNILTCLVRIGAKLYIFKALKFDDILTIVGTLTSVAQSVALYEASEFGLGKHFDLLSVSQQDSFFKSQYAADILLVLTLAICKVAYASGMRLLAKKNLLPLVFGCEIVSVVWGVTSLFVVFFQCRLPSPWLTVPDSRCIHRTAFYTYFSVFNILSDLAAIAVMCWSVSQLQASWASKSLVMCVFGSRILMVPAVIMQIIYSNRAFRRANDDVTFALWEATIAVIIVPCLAIASVCMPNFKFLLDTLESGQIRIDDLRRQGRSTSGSNGYYHYSGSHSHDSEGGKRSAGRSKNGNSSKIQGGSKVSMSSALGSRAHGKGRGGDLDLTQSEALEMTTFSSSAGDAGKAGKAGNARDAAAAAASATPGAASGHRHGGGGSNDGNTAWDQTSQSSQTILIHQSWRIDTQSAPDAEAHEVAASTATAAGPAGASSDSHGIHGIGVAVGMGGAV